MKILLIATAVEKIPVETGVTVTPTLVGIYSLEK